MLDDTIRVYRELREKIFLVEKYLIENGTSIERQYLEAKKVSGYAIPKDCFKNVNERERIFEDMEKSCEKAFKLYTNFQVTSFSFFDIPLDFWEVTGT